MQTNNQGFDVFMPYEEYMQLQEALKNAEAKNQSLKSLLAEIQKKQQMQKHAIMLLEEKIRTLSKTSLQHSRKIIDYEALNNNLQETIEELRRSIMYQKDEIQKQKQAFKDLQAQQMALSDRNFNLNIKLEEMQNLVCLKEKEVQLLYIQNAEKSKIIGQLSQNCLRLKREVQKLEIKERIFVADDEAEIEELRQQIERLKEQNSHLNQQNNKKANKLDEWSSIISEYQKTKERPQKNVIENYALYMHIYKQRLVSAEMLDDKIQEQMKIKRDSLYRALQRQYERIIHDK